MKKIKKLIVLALAVGMFATSVLSTSAAFDPVYYAAQNPDVVKELGNSPEMLKLHYDLLGRKEARMSNTNDVEAQLRRLFKADEYANLFPDVQKAFGDNKELMFQHYIAFGLLEGRRPSEKVSQDAADSLKKSVEKAMTDAKLEAKPGSVELVKVITGEIQTTVTTKNEAQKAEALALQTALTQVAEVVEKAVTETVQEVNKPTPVADSTPSSSKNEEPIYTSAAGQNVSWAKLEHTPASEGEGTETALKNKVAGLNNGKTVTVGNADNEAGQYIRKVTFPPVQIPKHRNGDKEGYWIGIAVSGSADSGVADYGFRCGYLNAETEDAAKEALKNFNFSDESLTTGSSVLGNDGTCVLSFYWSLKVDNAKKKYGGLLLTDTKNYKIYKYLVDLTTGVSIDDDSAATPPGGGDNQEVED